MTFTVIYNWGWVKHEDCRNAYSIHLSDCKIAQAAEVNENKNKIQGYTDNLPTLEAAIADAEDDATCRFGETLRNYGFKQMVKICKCAKVGA